MASPEPTRSDTTSRNINPEETKSEWGTATGASANRYNATNLPQQDGGKRLTAFMNIAQSQSVLVIGCGPGSDTLAIANLVGPAGRVDGIDLDRHSITKANEALRARPEFASFVNHYVGDAQDLSRYISGRKFDHVHVNATYHWIEDRPRFLSEVAALCAEGATIGIAGGDGNMRHPISVIRERVCEELDLHPAVLFRYPSDEDLRRDLSAAGFTDLSFEHFGDTYMFDDTNALLEWLDDSTGKQYLDRLLDRAGNYSQERARRAKKRILDEMDMFRLPTGKAAMLLCRLMVRARFTSGSK